MKTNILKNSLQFILYFFFVSCSQPKSHENTVTDYIGIEETGETSSFSAYADKQVSANTEEERQLNNHEVKIIRNADCRIKVDHVEHTMYKIKQLINDHRGYVADERYTHTNYVKENRFTIRIPQTHFDIILDSICSLATFVDHKNITTLDVSEEYIDISARLATKLKVRDRYETILRSKAKTVEDLLLTETKLNEIQEEIESAQGRLAYLTNKVALSTIQLDVYEAVIPKEEPKSYEPAFLDKALQGISFGWNMVRSIILLLFYIWPLLLLGILIFAYLKWIRK